MLSIIDRTYKTLILTDYGRKRVLENVANVDSGTISGFNLTHVCFGNKLSSGYDTSIDSMGNIVSTIELTKDNVMQIDNTFYIKVDIESTFDIREIGVYETDGNFRYLFAYLSGIELKKAPKNLPFKLYLNISLEESFMDFDFKDYTVDLEDGDYALQDDLKVMYNALSKVQINLERCIQRNARVIGFNRANVYYNEQKNISEYFNTFLLLDRFGKVVERFNSDEMTDYFVFPEINKTNYTLKNLVDVESTMNVTGEMSSANKDNIDFTRATSIVYTGTISNMSELGTIVAKSDPRNDKCYFEFVVTSDDVTNPEAESYLKFSAYSYDISLEQQLTVDNAQVKEPMLVGEYSIIYRVIQDKEMYKNFLNKECTFSFVFNGSEDNPKFDFYINDILITSEEKVEAGYVTISNFRFVRPPSFVDYDDNIRYDLIQDEEEGEVIKVSANLPDYVSELWEDTYYEVLSEEEVDKLKFMGVFDGLLRGTETVSNYDKTTGNMSEDTIQTTNNTPDLDYLRQRKIIGDITWRNYNIRHEFYENMRKSCTLKNYSGFVKTDIVESNNVEHKYESMQYYTLGSVKPASIITFAKALTKDEIVYLSNISRS